MVRVDVQLCRYRVASMRAVNIETWAVQMPELSKTVTVVVYTDLLTTYSKSLMLCKKVYS